MGFTSEQVGSCCQSLLIMHYSAEFSATQAHDVIDVINDVRYSKPLL